MMNNTDKPLEPRISLDFSKMLALGGVPADAGSSLKLSKPVGAVMVGGKPGSSVMVGPKPESPVMVGKPVETGD